MDNFLNEDERIDDLEIKGLKLIQKKNDYCFSSDAVLLANFVRAKKGDVVVDFGTGSGIISILIAAKTNASKVMGIELQKSMAQLAEKNVEFNNLTDKVTIYNDDIKNAENILGKESVSIVVCNPPYFKATSGEVSSNEVKAISRTELKITLEEIIQHAAGVLKYSGKLNMIHKSERLAEVLTTMSNNNLEPKKITFIYPKKSKQVDTFIVEAQKYGAPGVCISSFVVYEENGEMTNEAKKLYNKI